MNWGLVMKRMSLHRQCRSAKKAALRTERLGILDPEYLAAGGSLLKKILSLCLSLVLVCSLCVCLPGKAVLFTPGFDLHSSAALLLNLDTDEVLYQKNADTQYMPGSLVQIMEAIVVLENCNNLSMLIKADSSLYESFSHSEYPDDVRYANIKNDDILTVEELLYALMLTSSCEAATILANQFGNGSIQSFVDMMNAKATELGCTQTTFTNVTGMYDIKQKTTANDMALITEYALSIGKFQTIACASWFAPSSPNLERHSDDEWVWTHSNLLTQESGTYYMESVEGIKTANLTEQGRNIITMASRDGNNFLVILLAAPFNNNEGKLQYYHMDDAKMLFEWVFGHFSFRSILNDSTELGQVTVVNGNGLDYVLVRPEKSFGTLWYDMADVSSVVQVIDLPESVSAPVEQGQVLGTVTLKFSGEDITTVNLISTSEVKLSTMKYYAAIVKHFPKTKWLTSAILLSLLLCAIYIALCVFSHIQYLQRRRQAHPVHLKPNSAAAKREARHSDAIARKTKTKKKK